ncbi:MAG: mechanosensitive ion channel family protein [Rhodanobacteraceae bacterium]
MKAVQDWLVHMELLGIPATQWLLAIIVALGGYAIVHSALRLLARRLNKLAAHASSDTLTAIASALQRTSGVLIFLLFVLIGIHLLDLPDRTQIWLDRLAFLVAGLQIGLWLNTAIRAWTGSHLAGNAQIETNPVVLAMLGWFARILVWTTILLAVLGNMGVNITALVASLGVGGVAVALALQNVLGDLFASLSIGLDKPFTIGEFIQFGDITGTIARVGVKTTRIRALSGEEISIGNAKLLSQIIHNYGRMATRRIVFAFGVTMDTPRDKVQKVVEIACDVVRGLDKVELNRAHFKGFGDSSLDFEVVYTVQDPDYTLYMDIQQQINLELMTRLEAIDVHFAIPMSTLRVARATGNATPRRA